MLETVDFSLSDLTKDEYKETYDALIEKLVVLQQQARQKGVGLVVLFEGWNGAGKGSRISDLMYNLDARATSVHVTKNLDIERARSFAGRRQGVSDFYPLMQEFWQALGERGAITFYDRGWYTATTQQVLYNLFGSLSLPKNLGKRLVEADEKLKKSDEKNSDKGKKGAEGKNKHKAKAAKSKGASTNKTSTEFEEAARAIELLRNSRGKKTNAEILSAMFKSPRIMAEQAYVESIADFERLLVDDGYIVVKFFVHMTKRGQKERLTRLHSDPATAWRVDEEKLARMGNYEEAYAIYDKLVESSDFDFAPWTVLNGELKRRANITIAQTLVEALERALASKAAEKEVEGSASKDASAPTPAPACAAPTPAPALVPASSRFEIRANRPSLDKVRYDLALDRETYRKRLKKLQKELFELEGLMYQERIPLMIMYEGWDAAGKGGNIKRVAQALDARAYTIFPSPAPTRPELAHPHLWRYWTRLPKAGHVGIYDRSWYGRVLVERVEGFASPEQWARAYDEINAFERDLVEWGAILLKFWVDISQDEQLVRFNARQNDPNKQWKITDEDWRNREKYPQYREAVEDMFRLTSTTFAPWHILESDDKCYARIKALEIIVDALKKRLK